MKKTARPLKMRALIAALLLALAVPSQAFAREGNVGIGDIEEFVSEEEGEAIDTEASAEEENTKDTSAEETLTETSPEEENGKETPAAEESVETAEEAISREELLLAEAAKGAWYEDYTYTTDGDRILLSKYNGTDTDVIVPATATIGGKVYHVCLNGSVYKDTDIISALFGNGITGISFKGLFESCEKLERVDFNTIDTSQVTDMSSMFYGCSSLNSVDVSGFDTSNVEFMYYMFCACESLKTLDVSGFDTGKVTQMGSMFYGCQKLERLEVSRFNTSNVLYMGGLFAECWNLEALDVSHFDTSKVTGMVMMFYECKKLSSLDVSGFDTSKVTEMGWMFYDCESLKTLDVSGFDTSEVTDMFGMFDSCYGLQELDVSGFNTSKATNLGYMFTDCRGIRELDVSGFDTSKTDQMQGMFWGCSSLESLDLSSFDTSLVTWTKQMFDSCSSLKSLDLSRFDLSKVTDASNAENMLASMSALEELYTPRNVKVSIPLSKKLFEENGTPYTSLPMNRSISVYLTDVTGIKSISLNAAEITIKPGDTFQLEATTLPAAALNHNVIWSSDNTSAVSVNSHGIVIAKSPGNAVITATAEDGGKTAQCEVSVGYDIPACKTPKNTSAGVSFSWKEVDGASKYRVFRKTGSGEYTKLTDTSATSVTDSGVTSGTAYTYTVCCLYGEEEASGRETGKTITFLATPVVNAPTSAKAGVRVSWPTVKGAAKYVIQRHVGAGAPSWKWLKTVNAESGSTQVYVDDSSEIRSGEWYAYTIRAITANGTYSGQVGGRSIKYLAPVEVNKVQSVPAGVRVIFTNVKGGYTYRLYRSTKGSSGTFGAYERVSEVTKVWKDAPQTVWIHDTTAKKGTTYRYYVRCVSKDGAVPLSSYMNYMQISY